MPAVLVLFLLACENEPTDSGKADVTAPVIVLDAPALGSSWSPIDGVPVAATVTDDVDGPLGLSVELRSDIDGTVGAPLLDDDGSFSTTLALSVGVHLLTVVAADSAGNESVSSATIRVLENGMTQPAVELAPVAPVTGDDLTATIVTDSIDPVGADFSYVWSWTVSGADAGIGEATVPGTAVSVGQEWSVSVYATDGTYTSHPATATVTIGNAPATVDNLRVEIVNDEVDCLWDGVGDPDDGITDTVASMSINGVDQGETDHLDRADVRRNDEVVCTLHVVSGDAVDFQSAPLSIPNGDPSITGATIAPDAPTEADVLTCLPVGIEDPDGDPATYDVSWTVGSTTYVNPTLDGASFARGDTVRCDVAVTDPYGGTASSSASVEIGNTAPGAPIVGFVRDRVVPGATAECLVVTDAADIDGDVISYTWAWSADGVDLGETSATLDTTGLATGSLLTCTATPTDGMATGATGSAELRVTAPMSGEITDFDADVILSDDNSGATFGKALDAVWDLDGDGRTELLVSAPGDSGGGAVYLFSSATLTSGATLGVGDATASWVGDEAGDNLGGGRGVAGAGDVDGDGVGDILLAAPYEDSGGSESGIAYLLYGGGTWGIGGTARDSAEARFAGVEGDWLGVRMASGDLNADGISDIVLAAPYNDLGGNKAGAFFVYDGSTSRYGGAYTEDDADATVYGEGEDVELGWALDVSGDGNGDGYGEVLTGVFYDNPGDISHAGTGLVISGDDLEGVAAAEDIAFLIVHGLAEEDRFGYDAQGLGDVDADGLEDFMFGAYLSDEVATDAGSARLFYGTNGMNREQDADTADASFFGSHEDDEFGSVIASAGDLDGDGSPDFLVGAPTASPGDLEAAGLTWLYRGSSIGGWSDAGTDADLRVSGSAADDRFGDELAGDLEINGDGYGDFAVGAQKADLGASGGGAVYVYFGP